MFLSIVTVTNKKLMKQFINFEWEIYKDSKNWISPLKIERRNTLNTKKFPFFENAEMELYIAFRNNKVVGRIAAILNHAYNKTHNTTTGFFGFFESENNIETASNLFRKAENWLKSKGCNEILGPASPSSTYNFGLLIDGFDIEPTFQMGYNHSYYQSLIEDSGFTKAKDLYNYAINYEEVVYNQQLKRVARVVQEQSGMIVRPLRSGKGYHEDSEHLRRILNSAWEDNWGTSPINVNEMKAMAKDMKLLIEPNGFLFGEIDGEVVGFIMAWLDYNVLTKHFNGKLFPFNFIKLLTQKKNIKTGRIHTFGILPEYRMQGLDALLYYELLKKSYERGITHGEAGWILEDNLMMNRSIKKFGGVKNKTYRVFSKQL